MDPRKAFTFFISSPTEPTQVFKTKGSLILEKPDIPTPSHNIVSPSVSLGFPSSVSLSAPHSCFPHHFLILDGELRQLASQLLVKVQVFGHAAVQTHRLTLRQLWLFVMWRYALPVAGVGHPGREGSQETVGFLENYVNV